MQLGWFAGRQNAPAGWEPLELESREGLHLYRNYQKPVGSYAEIGFLTEAGRVFERDEIEERFVHRAKWIGTFVESAGREPFSVGTSRNGADAAVIDLLPALVSVKSLGIERAYDFAGGHFPLIEHSHQVATEEELSLRMKCHAVHVPRMTR